MKNNTQGAHPIEAQLFGHINACSVSPFHANASPATQAAKQFPVQRRARKYIPIPAIKKWSREKYVIACGPGMQTNSADSGYSAMTFHCARNGIPQLFHGFHK